MRSINKLAAFILASFYSFLSCFAQQSTQTTPLMPEILPSLALSALESTSKAQQTKLDTKLRDDRILIYRVIVNSDGSLLRTEKISGDSDLQAVADPFVSGWHFKEVDISGSASSWRSLIGVCFFRDGDYMLPCYVPQAQTNEKASDALPTRLFLVGNAEGNHYNFPPLQKKKGARLERPPLLRQLGTTGGVVLDVVIALDGRVSEATVIKGHPLLLAATVQAVRTWQFAPITFLGKPVEVQLRFRVLYGRGD
jgi:TonB family protein